MSEAVPATAGAAGSGGVGPALRAARERRGLSIAAVHEATHIDSRLIEAMEEGRFTVFDAPVYARGFIRKYGSFLDLPVEDLIAGYDSLAGGPAPPSMIPITNSAVEPRDLGPVKLGAAAALLLVLLGGAYWWWAGRASAPHAPPPVVGAVAAVAPKAEAPQPPSPGPAEPAELPATAALAAEPAVARAAPAAERPAPKALAARAASSAPLIVTGLRECWVEVYAASGSRLLYDLVQAGDSRALPGPAPWRVFLGNADGVQLSLDQHPIAVPAAKRAGATARLMVMADGAVK